MISSTDFGVVHYGTALTAFAVLGMRVYTPSDKHIYNVLVHIGSALKD